jgi:hypothetical protein
MLDTLALLLLAPAATAAFTLPPFSWDVIPRARRQPVPTSGAAGCRCAAAAAGTGAADAASTVDVAAAAAAAAAAAVPLLLLHLIAAVPHAALYRRRCWHNTKLNSTDVLYAGFIHCGPNPPKPTPMSNGERQLSLPEIYEGMAQFPMATLEKVGQSVPSCRYTTRLVETGLCGARHLNSDIDDLLAK